MLNKNTWGVKKCEANQKQHCKQAGVTKGLISVEAKKDVTLSIYVTGFAKTAPNRTRIEIPFIAWHES